MIASYPGRVPGYGHEGLAVNHFQNLHRDSDKVCNILSMLDCYNINLNDACDHEVHVAGISVTLYSLFFWVFIFMILLTYDDMHNFTALHQAQ